MNAHLQPTLQTFRQSAVLPDPHPSRIASTSAQRTEIS
jgi:hypothetical protein